MINIKKIVIGLINLYQKLPLSTHKLCRYTPTCSEYMKEAVERYNYYGFKLGIKRILRCNPLSKYLYDPVPNILKIHFNNINKNNCIITYNNKDIINNKNIKIDNINIKINNKRIIIIKDNNIKIYKKRILTNNIYIDINKI